MHGNDPISTLIFGAIVLLGAALAAALLLRGLRQPAVVGYLAAGMAVGPSGLNLIRGSQVEPLTEIALILLMFIVGLELSPRKLAAAGWRAIAAGLLQMILTAACAYVAAERLLGCAPPVASIVTAAVTISSTAVTVKRLSDRDELESVHGKLLVVTLLLQDLAVIAFLVLMPLLRETAGAAGGMREAWATLLRSGGVLLAAAGLAWLVLPRLVSFVASHGGRELLALFAVVCATGGAGLAMSIHWSPALGAFLVGLMLAESDTRHQLAAEILPFRDVFNALFFVTMGMLLDVSLLTKQPAFMLLAIAAVLLGKAMLAGASARILGWPARIAALFGIGLASMSEFALLVAREGLRLELVDQTTVERLMTVAAGTIMLGALLQASGPSLAAFGPPAGLLRRRDAADAPGDARAARNDAGRSDGGSVDAGHVIIVGYGLNGQNLSRVLRGTNIRHVLIEMNRALAVRARADQTPRVIIGDASRTWILERAGLAGARVMVVAINDIEATRRIVAQAARLRPDLYVLARSRYVSEIETLYRLGARMVIPEEFETSIELFAHVLKQFGVADNVIAAQVELVRAGRYGMLRGAPRSMTAQAEVLRVLEATATQTHQVQPDSPAAGRTLLDLNLRSATGVTVIAVVRAGRPQTPPPPDMPLASGDVLVLVGPHKGLEQARAMLNPPAAAD